VPSFEETRARTQLSIVGRDGKKHQVTYLPWKESKDPYAKLRETLDARGTGKIVVDEGMRAGIADELRNGLGGKREIIVSPKAVREIRERKTTEELALLKCANEVSHLSSCCLEINGG
jgi:Xaa-Pro aminopeptidase